jgi:hypothetical protein
MKCMKCVMNNDQLISQFFGAADKFIASVKEAQAVTDIRIEELKKELIESEIKLINYEATQKIQN